MQATGEVLFQIIKESLSDYGLSLSDSIGLGCDGAAVMVGENNSVWSRVKAEFPNCMLIKCVCHSLALCVQKSFETLPSSLGFLLTEIPGWLSKNTVRRHAWNNLFQEMNEDSEEEEKNKKLTNIPFLKISGTR